MKLVDFWGNKIELTKERWQHIINEHPEVKDFKGKLKEVINLPDLVKHSKKDKNVLLYYRYYSTVFDGKYLLAVVKLGERSFLLTYYVTNRIKEGNAIWRKN